MQSDMMKKFSEIGFIINENSMMCKDLPELIEYYDGIEKIRSKLDYDIDGVVYKINSFRIQNYLGEVSRAPRWAIAHKFTSQKAKTIIENIIIQVGRTGALTPVAIVQPVNIGGALISRATLHNEEEIAKYDFRIGDLVEIERSGDVIPNIIGVDLTARSSHSTPFQMPDLCPICGNDAIKEDGEAVRRCQGGLHCKGQLIERLKHFIKAFAIDGIGDRQIEDFYNLGFVQQFVDIFKLEKNNAQYQIQNLPGFGEKSTANLFDAINAKRKVEMQVFIYSLSIRYVGSITAKILSESFNSIDSFLALPKDPCALEKLVNIQGIGPKVGTSVLEFLSDQVNIDIVMNLLSEIEVFCQPKIPLDNSDFDKFPLYGQTLVFTGTLKTMTREECKEIAQKLGANVIGSVSKNVTSLIAGEQAGSKLEKAKSLNIQILTEGEWLKKLEKFIDL